MSDSVEAKFIWDEGIALLSSELFYKYEFRHSYRRYMGWVFIAMAQFGVVGALKHDAYGMLIVSSFLLLYWYVVRWQLRKKLALRHFKASSMVDQEVVTKFDDKGLHTNNRSTLWPDIHKVVETALGFLFYSDSSANFFAKEAFNSNEQQDVLRKLIKNSNVNLVKAL